MGTDKIMTVTSRMERPIELTVVDTYFLPAQGVVIVFPPPNKSEGPQPYGIRVGDHVATRTGTYPIKLITHGKVIVELEDSPIYRLVLIVDSQVEREICHPGDTVVVSPAA